MGRRKIDIEPITNERNRTVTFIKRKAGLFKKAHELAILCNVDIAVVILGSNKQVYEYSSVDTNEMISVYQRKDIVHHIKEPCDYGSQFVKKQFLNLEKKTSGGSVHAVVDSSGKGKKKNNNNNNNKMSDDDNDDDNDDDSEEEEDDDDDDDGDELEEDEQEEVSVATRSNGNKRKSKTSKPTTVKKQKTVAKKNKKVLTNENTKVNKKDTKNNQKMVQQVKNEFQKIYMDSLTSNHNNNHSNTHTSGNTKNTNTDSPSGSTTSTTQLNIRQTLGSPANTNSYGQSQQLNSMHGKSYSYSNPNRPPPLNIHSHLASNNNNNNLNMNMNGNTTPHMPTLNTPSLTTTHFLQHTDSSFLHNPLLGGSRTPTTPSLRVGETLMVTSNQNNNNNNKQSGDAGTNGNISALVRGRTSLSGTPVNGTASLASRSGSGIMSREQQRFYQTSRPQLRVEIPATGRSLQTSTNTNNNSTVTSSPTTPGNNLHMGPGGTSNDVKTEPSIHDSKSAVLSAGGSIGSGSTGSAGGQTHGNVLGTPQISRSMAYDKNSVFNINKTPTSSVLPSPLLLTSAIGATQVNNNNNNNNNNSNSNSGIHAPSSRNIHINGINTSFAHKQNNNTLGGSSNSRSSNNNNSSGYYMPQSAMTSPSYQQYFATPLVGPSSYANTLSGTAGTLNANKTASSSATNSAYGKPKPRLSVNTSSASDNSNTAGTTASSASSFIRAAANNSSTAPATNTNNTNNTNGSNQLNSGIGGLSAVFSPSVNYMFQDWGQPPSALPSAITATVTAPTTNPAANSGSDPSGDAQKPLGNGGK